MIFSNVAFGILLFVACSQLLLNFFLFREMDRLEHHLEASIKSHRQTLQAFEVFVEALHQEKRLIITERQAEQLSN